jgi:NAD(P)H-hydrate repair Nnr-like enzyme with NAD(P)H-hydrate dehydratase domain
MLAHLLSVAGPALVVDADGLRLAPLHQRRSSERPLIVTPHPGEFRVLATAYGIPDPSTDESSRRRAATALAHAINAIVVLKGHRTVVASTDQVWTCQTGGVELAIPGSGDVLTGIIVSLLAQQWADTGAVLPFDAAQLGVQAMVSGAFWQWNSQTAYLRL